MSDDAERRHDGCELAGRRVLIVEDQRDIAEILDAFFAREEAQRLIAYDGQDAISAVDLFRPDLIVLDLKLPKKDGWSVLATIRARELPTPILVVSALGDDADKLAGFRLGCDDYVVKPFNPLEIVARAKVALRRVEQMRKAAIVIGTLRIEPEAHRVTVEGQLVDLTPVEYRIMLALAERPGRLITRSYLVDTALDEEAFDSSVNPHVSRLRQKIARSGIRITPIRGEGYRLDVSR